MKLTEAEWRLREEFRRDWASFCDCDPVAEDFPERMEAAGFIELGSADELPEDPFVWEKYGDDPPTTVWLLTPAGRSLLNAAEEQEDE